MCTWWSCALQADLHGCCSVCEVLWGFVWGPLVAVVGLFEGSLRIHIKTGRVSSLG